MLVTPIATGSVTLQSLINVLGGFSSLGYTVFGYNDGAGMPDATTQADINALIALGIPEARIAWVDLGTLNAFTIAGVASASSIENLVLSQAGGVFVIAAASSATDIENIVITGLSVFTIQDLESASEIENIDITSIGQFIVAAIASASAIENVVMSQHGGTFAVAGVSSASGIDNVEISEQIAGYTYGFEDGLTTGLTGVSVVNETTVYHSGSASGFAFTTIEAATYGNIYSKAFNIASSGNGSFWYFHPAIAESSQIRVYQGGSLIHTVAAVNDDAWHQVVFPLTANSNSTITFGRVSSFWNNGEDSGYDDGMAIDDIAIPGSPI
jgi:hypothetical protein